MNYLNTLAAKELFKALLSLKSENEYRMFLRDLLTETELKEFINRWKVAQMLDKQVPYEKISKKTGISSTTIARISKWLMKGMGGYQLVLSRIKSNVKNKTVKIANKTHHTRLTRV